MKHKILFFVCLLACLLGSAGVGGYFGYIRAYQFFRQESLKVLSKADAEVAELNIIQAEQFKSAKPYEESAASGALSTLKCLDTNDLADARAKLAAMIAVYYTSHQGDGDTNLLSNIVKFAASDTVLSNAIYRKYSWSH
jgi:predicted negative regulator of RcsB-dependent stress response